MTNDMPAEPLQIDAVVFDMDGLIFNSEDLYDIAAQRLLGRHGKQFGLEYKLPMMGKKADQAIAILCELAELPDSPEATLKELHEYLLESLDDGLQTMPGFNQLLQYLEANDVRRAIATSSPRELAELMLSRFQLPDRFEFILTGDDVVQGKPHPEMYLTAANKLAVAPQTMLVFEDSLAGSQAAVAAGAITVAVPNEHTKGCDFSHVHFVANTLNDPRIEQTISTRKQSMI